MSRRRWYRALGAAWALLLGCSFVEDPSAGPPLEFGLVTINGELPPAPVATGVDQFGEFTYQMVSASITLVDESDSLQTDPHGRFDFAYTAREIRGSQSTDFDVVERGSYRVLRDSLVELTYSDGRRDNGVIVDDDSELTFVANGPPRIVYVFRRR